jgi:hypothetical protein
MMVSHRRPTLSEVPGARGATPLAYDLDSGCNFRLLFEIRPMVCRAFCCEADSRVGLPQRARPVVAVCLLLLFADRPAVGAGADLCVPLGGPVGVRSAQPLGRDPGQEDRWAPGAGSVAAAAELAERSTLICALRRARHPAHRAVAVCWPRCALARSHGGATGTDLDVRARAVMVVCGAWRAGVAAARRLRAAIGFGVPAGPSLGAVRRAVQVPISILLSEFCVWYVV